MPLTLFPMASKVILKLLSEFETSHLGVEMTHINI